MDQELLMGMPLPVMLALVALCVPLAVTVWVALSLRRRPPVRPGLYLAWDARRDAGRGHDQFRLASEPIDERGLRR